MLEPLEATNPDHAKTQLHHIPFLSHYSSKTDFLSYVLLYLVKMPFPPVTRPQSLPSSGNKKLPGPSTGLVKTVEEKSYVKERLKKMSRKATPHKSKLPTSRSTSGLRLEGKSTWITSSRPADPSSTSTHSSSKSSSGISTSATSSFATNSKDATNTSMISTSKQMFPASMSATNISMNITTGHCKPQASPRSTGAGRGQKNREAMNFSLNLTPEATLLLQKRSREKQLRAVRGGTGTVTAHHWKDITVKSGSRSSIPLVKISLLNDHHRYDDVEYEEQDEQGVDQSVLLKCSEWLRGVENAAGATVLGRVDKISHKTI